MRAPGPPGRSVHVAVGGLCPLTPAGGAICSLAHQGSSFLAWRRGPFCCVPLPRAGPQACWLVQSPVLCGSSLTARPPVAGTLEPATVSLCCWRHPWRFLQRPLTRIPSSLSPSPLSLLLPIFLPAFPLRPFFSLRSSQSPFFLSSPPSLSPHLPFILLPSLSPLPFASLSPDAPSPSPSLSFNSCVFLFPFLFLFLYFLSPAFLS